MKANNEKVQALSTRTMFSASDIEACWEKMDNHTQLLHLNEYQRWKILEAFADFAHAAGTTLVNEFRNYISQLSVNPSKSNLESIGSIIERQKHLSILMLADIHHNINNGLQKIQCLTEGNDKVNEELQQLKTYLHNLRNYIK